MRKIFENGISLIAALLSLGLCIQWYRNTGEIEPQVGIIASTGILLTALVYRIFPEKRQHATQDTAQGSEGVTSSHALTTTQTKNAVSDSQLSADRDLHVGDTINNYIHQHCLTLWKELSEAHPTYAEFTQNFDWAKQALE